MNKDMTKTDKSVKKYTKMYREALKRNGFPDFREKAEAYADRLAAMFASDAYKMHDVYPSVSMAKVYAIIAMCLMLKSYGLEKEEVYAVINDAFAKIKKRLGRIERLIDISPMAWTIAKKWNVADHDARVKDGSIIYDYFIVEDERISYKISKCMYVEIFDYYGIKEYCKVMCMTDMQIYSNLKKHIVFDRRSDLSDGESCLDDIRKRK